MTIKIFKTEDEKKFCLSRIDNDGRFNENAKCTSALYDLPDEFEFVESSSICKIPMLFYRGNMFATYFRVHENGNPVIVVPAMTRGIYKEVELKTATA